MHYNVYFQGKYESCQPINYLFERVLGYVFPLLGQKETINSEETEGLMTFRDLNHIS